MIKSKVIMQAKYKKGARILHNLSLPDLNHLNDGFYCCDAEITSAGIIEKDGVRYEFQDIRVIVKERGKP